jgi:hypothetical protein
MRVVTRPIYATAGQQLNGPQAAEVPCGLVVSRRNLLSLLAKLDGSPSHSACTIMYGGFRLTAEENDVHYAHPERDLPHPGAMHPDTERALLPANFGTITPARQEEGYR